MMCFGLATIGVDFKHVIKRTKTHESGHEKNQRQKSHVSDVSNHRCVSDPHSGENSDPAIHCSNVVFHVFLVLTFRS